MLQYSTLLQRTILFLSLIVLISQIQLSQAASKDHFINTDSNESADEQRRAYDLKQLRHFLLTSNAEQRAAKREQRNFLKRKLINEYLQSVNDPDPNRLIEMKKRYKTFCQSFEDLLNPGQSACG
jgi:predicted nucleic acid-binding protein